MADSESENEMADIRAELKEQDEAREEGNNKDKTIITKLKLK